MFKVVVRGREVNSFQSLKQALEELRGVRASGEREVLIRCGVRRCA